MDAQDSAFSSLVQPGEIAIANGADVLRWKSKKGLSRNFTRFNSTGYPTWNSTGINGKGALVFNGVCLVVSDISDLAGLSGLTVSVEQQRVGNGAVPGDEGSYHLTATAGGLGNALAQVYVGSEATHTSGGRRVGTDTYAGVTGSAVTNGVPYLSTVSYDFAAGTVTLYQNGVLQGTQSLASTGTMATPYAMSVGGRATGGATTIGSQANCLMAGALLFLRAMTKNELSPRMRWQMARIGL